MSSLKRIKKAVFTCGEAAFSGISQTLDEKIVFDQLFKPLLWRQEISVKKKMKNGYTIKMLAIAAA